MGDLQSIPGIGEGVEKRLRQQGVEDIEELANSDPDEISVPTGNTATLISRANQRTISTQTASEMLDQYGETGYVSTGVELLDGVLGGGWEDETVGIPYGQSGKGKTQLVLSSIVQAAAEGPAVYVQTEMQSRSVSQRLYSIAMDTEEDADDILDNIHFYEAYSIEDQYATYQKIEEDHSDLEFIVVDSFTAQFRVADDLQGRQNLGSRSKEIGRHLKKVASMARTYSIPVALTGQVYPTPEAYGKSDKLWGGEKLRHFVSYFIRMSSGQGELVESSLENHPGHEEQSILINITSDGLDGVDNTT